MREYLITVLCVSAVTAVLGILPSDEKMKRSVSFALSLVLLAAVVLPLPALLTDLPRDFSAYLEELEGEIASGSDYLEGETLAAVGDGIAAHLADRYGLARGAISAVVEGDIVDNTVILTRVTLWLTGRAAAADVPRIVRAIEADTGAECCVEYPK